MTTFHWSSHYTLASRAICYWFPTALSIVSASWKPTLRYKPFTIRHGYGTNDIVLVPFISSADTNNPIVSTYSILAEDLDAITPKSACNYKLRIEESRTDAVAYSEYFAVIKANDNGINATTLCPDPEGSLAPFSDLCRFVPNKSICTRLANEVYRLCLRQHPPS